MKISVLKIFMLAAVLIVLVSVSGGIFAQAQTGADQNPAGQASSSSSATDSNTPVVSQPVDNANEADAVYARPAAMAPDATMWFKFVAGSTFQPRSSASTYASSGSGGCIYNIADPSEVYNADVQFPNGSTIDIVRMYYYDASASNSQGWLTRYDGAGGLLDITYNVTSGNAGFGSNPQYPSYVVDNYDYGLVLNWRPGASDVNLQLCGFRVRYWAVGPFFLPTIMNH